MSLRASYERNEKKFDGVVSVILGLLLWQIVDSAIHNPLVLVGPSQIVDAFTKLLVSGQLQRNVYATFVEFILGYILGVTFGIGMGVLMGLNRGVNQILSPWVTISYNAPIILLAPLFITALGVGIASKIAITFIGAVFPVLFNTYAAMTTVDGRLVEAVRAFGGSRSQIFFHVTVPSSLPLVMTGLRLSIGRALIGAIVSEFFGSMAGIGYMITAATEAFNTADAFVGVVILAAWGYLAFEVLKYLERRIAPWHQFEV
jgi:NitT/TauT family transport system permease protein